MEGQLLANMLTLSVSGQHSPGCIIAIDSAQHQTVSLQADAACKAQSCSVGAQFPAHSQHSSSVEQDTVCSQQQDSAFAGPHSSICKRHRFQ